MYNACARFWVVAVNNALAAFHGCVYILDVTAGGILWLTWVGLGEGVAWEDGEEEREERMRRALVSRMSEGGWVSLIAAEVRVLDGTRG